MAASRFVWFELCTDDPAAAVDFYRSVVGWGARDAGVGAGPYTLLTVGEAPVAGVMAMPEELARIGRRPA
ncbi:MAG TPA: VOC family protein, partial [Burkholderiaceae bacterium]